jgi:hypothetical protein
LFLGGRLRCTNLQELGVGWQGLTADDERSSDDDSSSHYESPSEMSVHFKGTGSTPLEQRASMQRQLAALCSSPHFLAPESWPACACLTSVKSDGGSFEGEASYTHAATHTPSLATLEVDMSNARTGWLSDDLSSLQRLTSLKLTNITEPFRGVLDEESVASIGHLRSLQRLDIDLNLLDEGSGDDEEDQEGEGNEGSKGFAIPASWSALSSLTRVCLTPTTASAKDDHSPCVAAAQLSRLSAVEDLQLYTQNYCFGACGAVIVGEVSSLFALTRLTNLVGPAKFAARGGGDSEDEDAGSSSVLEVPQQWKDRLQSLSWKENPSRSSIAMLSQLTSLTYLELSSILISRQLCRYGTSRTGRSSAALARHMSGETVGSRLR